MAKEPLYATQDGELRAVNIEAVKKDIDGRSGSEIGSEKTGIRSRF